MKKIDCQENVLYFDISEFLLTRHTTGIQRVIREFLSRAMNDSISIRVIYFEPTLSTFKQLSNNEIKSFLNNIKQYVFTDIDSIDLFTKSHENRIFFDMDSIWNSPMKRECLYPKLKKFNYQICNFIYDLIPVMFPDYLYEKTKENFAPFLSAVFKYSDIVFLDSYSSKHDFENIKDKLNITKKIRTNVVYLGSDFVLNENETYKEYSKILASKFILFVGTIEPRKCQPQVLEAFEVLHKRYPQLNLVFIGRIGWNMDEFVEYLQNHPLLNQNIFHFKNIDDSTLSDFYKNAFIVTYLSKYEGYGLPVAESLTYGNVTITSKNSSLVEVGSQFVDYVKKFPKKELIAIISKYIKNESLYQEKKALIQASYKSIHWDSVYQTIMEVLDEKGNKSL